MVEHHNLLYGDLADPVALLRGETSSRGLGAFWAYAETGHASELRPERTAAYTRLMAASQAMVAREVVAEFPFRRYRRLLDVGGGDGSFLEAVASTAPDLELELFDLPAVAAEAGARFARTGLASRATAVGGDFRHDALPSGADLASLVRVLHDHDDEDVTGLLAAVWQALSPGGTILVAEPMADTAGAERVGGAYFGFYLLAMGQGRARSPAELGGSAAARGLRRHRTPPHLAAAGGQSAGRAPSCRRRTECKSNLTPLKLSNLLWSISFISRLAEGHRRCKHPPCSWTDPDGSRSPIVTLLPPVAGDVVVDIDWSGVSTGTERLLWSGEMPPFPGLGYPLVPGYEAVGRVVDVVGEADHEVGDTVFVPGAQCYKDVRGLFGGSAARLIVPGRRAVPVDAAMGDRATLLALAATAYHTTSNGNPNPDLIVGHGVLGRLLARLAILTGAPAPTVWEREPTRRRGATGYAVIDPADDDRRDYRAIVDVSGDAGLVDGLIGRLAPGGEIVLAGFYKAPISFAFPPAFMREARLRVSAEWQPADLAAVNALVASGRLSLDGLITHREAAAEADPACRTAFGDPECLKMILDWRDMR